MTQYSLVNQTGVELRVLDYGCTITSVMLPDRQGQMADVVLGYDTLEEYLASPHYMGAVIGRCAGRIREGRFTLEDKEYQLSRNAFPHHLHGGTQGLDKILWIAEPFENEKGIGVDFRYLSADGHEGYPAAVYLTVRYYLTHQDALIINYIAEVKTPTILNLTQHTYWNLAGTASPVLNMAMQVNADRFLPVDADKLPTGELRSVDHTPFDFRNPRQIAAAFDVHFDQLRLGMGLDHCWALNKAGDELGPAAMLYDPPSGRFLSLHTTAPGLQIYTGNALAGMGKNNTPYGPFAGISLETQHFPDSPNHPHFPSIVVRPDAFYTSTTVFQFSTLT